jgi:hypothetical protein
MRNKQKIGNLDKRLSKKIDTNFNLVLKMERWMYDIGAPKEPVTLQEWRAYKERELVRAEDKEKMQQHLKELEDKIRAGNGFVEINFIESIPKELRDKYGIDSVDL